MGTEFRSAKKELTSREIVLCALFVALTIVGAFIKIPVPVCPFTLQLLFTTLAGLLLGKRLGAIAVGLYVVLGLIGLPVFTEGGGPSYVLQPTFGYLVGFVLGAYACGAIAEGSTSLKRVFVASFVNLAIVYGLGMVYLYIIMNFYLGHFMSVANLFWYCFVLQIPGDILLCVIASLLRKRLLPFVRK